MAANIFVNPNEVFEAIAYAKETNKDEYGDSAFNIETNGRNAKGCAFHTFTILKKQNGKWGPIPLKLRFVNLPTQARLIKKELGSTDSTKYDGACLQFSRSSKSTQNGVEQLYGEAKHAICEAFKRIAAKMVANNKLKSKNTMIRTNLQYTFGPNNADMADPIIRVQIPFAYEMIGNAKVYKPDSLPEIEIFNINKPVIKDGKQVPGKFHKIAMEDGSPMIYSNANQCIKPGSVCSGIDDMSAVTLSNMGISNPSKASILMIKPSTGRGIKEICDVFAATEIAEMGAAIVEDIEEVDAADGPSSPAPKKVSSSELNMDDQFSEVDDSLE